MKNSILILILLVGVVVVGYLFINKKDQDNLILNQEESSEIQQTIQTQAQNNNQGPNNNPKTENSENSNLNFECSIGNQNSQGDDLNGCHPGLITSVSGLAGNYSLTIDYIILDACPPINPGDECLINNNPMIRTFPISNNAMVKTFNENWEPISISLQNFASNFSTGSGAAPNTLQGGTMYKLNRIKIENGAVVEISPIYLP